MIRRKEIGLHHDSTDREVPGLAVSSVSDIGRVRKNNEDTVGDPWLLPDLVGPRTRLATRGVLLAVADGMGGHAKGEVASRLAIDTLFTTYYGAEGDRAEDLREAVATANRAVFRCGSPDPGSVRDPQRMGTTLVAAVIAGEELIVANVGDSRAYRLHFGAIQQLSHDHSFVAEELRAGAITAEDARNFPYKNVITRSIGSTDTVDVDVFRSPWLPGDRLLLCSDGLHGVVPDEIICDALVELAPKEGVQALVRIAIARGGPDNVSVIVAAQAAR